MQESTLVRGMRERWHLWCFAFYESGGVHAYVLVSRPSKISKLRSSNFSFPILRRTTSQVWKWFSQTFFLAWNRMILNVFITACRGTFKARVALLMRRKTGARCGKVANELAERNLVSPQTTGIYCSERASTDIILPKSKLKKAEGDG